MTQRVMFALVGIVFNVQTLLFLLLNKLLALSVEFLIVLGLQIFFKIGGPK